MTGTGSLSCQSFSPQPFQILAQCFLLLFVFGQWAVRWTEYVVVVIFAFAHDVTFRRLGGLRWAGEPRPPGHCATNGGNPAQISHRLKIGLGGRATRAIRFPPHHMLTAEHREPCDSRGSCTFLGAPGFPTAPVMLRSIASPPATSIESSRVRGRPTCRCRRRRSMSW